MMLIVSGVSALIHLYSVAYMGGDRGYARFFAYLNFFVFSMLLLVEAANFLLLIIGWAFVGAASYFLISFWYRRKTATDGRHQGVRHQRARRRRARARDLLHLPRAPGTLDFLRAFEEVPAGVRRERRRPRRRLPAAARRRVRQVGPGPAPHLAPGRHGGPDAGLRPDPRGDHGHRRRLPDRAHAPAVRAGADRRRRRRGHRLPDAADRGHDRPRGDRPQARHRLLDDVADRLHGHGRLVGRLRRRHVPPDDARLLQGAALHGGRLGDRGDGRHPEPRPHVGLPARDAVHLRLHDRRRPRAVRHPAVLAASSPRTRSSRCCSSARTGTPCSACSATSARS